MLCISSNNNKKRNVAHVCTIVVSLPFFRPVIARVMPIGGKENGEIKNAEREIRAPHKTRYIQNQAAYAS